MTTELITVPFHGDNLFVATIDGQPYAPMKPIVEGMGLDWAAQFTKINGSRFKSTVAMIAMVAEDGKPREMVGLPLKKLPAWLFSINANKVRPELRDKIITYQNECDDALWDYWTKGQATKATYSGTYDHQPQSIAPSPIQEILSINDRLSQLPGAEPVAIMDATLTMIEQATGYKVDAFRQVLPPVPNQPQSKSERAHISNATTLEVKPSRELKIDGEISIEDIESWKEFCGQSMHMRLLQLHWISRNRSELAVLWSFCEHHRRTATLGEKYHRRDSSRLITSKLGDRIDCNQVGVSRAINALLDEGILCKKAHVDNVIRKLWLNWPVLAQRLKTTFPAQIVLHLNWLVDNKVELCVLCMLSRLWTETYCFVDDVKSTPFVKVTLKTVEPFADQLGVATNAKSVERAVAKLSEAGLIELSDQGVMNKARISTTCFSSITTFLEINFENELW